MESDFPSNLRLLTGYYRSVAEVCRRIDVNRSQFNKYLSGSSVPSLHVLKKICDFFGVEPYEIQLPHAQFAQIVQVKSASAAGAADRPYIRLIDELTANSQAELARYAGYYFEYYYSMGFPGLILRSLFHLSTENGTATYRRVERLARPDAEGRCPRCRYLGLAFYLRDRIFLVDYEGLTGNEMTQTILYPSYQSRVSRLYGLKLGVSSAGGRQPACARVAFEALGARIDARKALRLCGLFDPDSPDIDPAVRDRIDNAGEDGAHHFLAPPA